MNQKVLPIIIILLVVIGLAALGTGIYLYFNNLPGSTTAEEQSADNESSNSAGDNSDSRDSSSDNENSEDQEFYGSSTYSECSCGCSCVIDGCNGEICRGKDDDPVNTVCSLPDKPLPPDLGYFCTCIQNECQWAK